MVICLALTMQFASGCGKTIEETFDFAAVPAYDGKAYVAVNDNVPFFTEEELSSALILFFHFKISLFFLIVLPLQNTFRSAFSPSTLCNKFLL